MVVRAFVAGVAADVLDFDFTMAGLTSPEPYSMTLDLGGAVSGNIVTLLAIGDTGLSNATGEFAAIPVVIAG